MNNESSMEDDLSLDTVLCPKEFSLEFVEIKHTLNFEKTNLVGNLHRLVYVIK